MKRLLLSLLLLLLTAARPLAAQAPATTLSGTVRDAAGRALPGVNVFLKSTFDGASTDSLGRFRFRTRATGTLPLVVTTLGYLPQEQSVVLDGTAKTLAFVLKEVRNQLGDVVITSGTFEAGDTRRSTVFSARDVVTTAGASADVAGAFNTMPGTTRNGEEGRLFVRGGAAGETKQYLDGLLLQSPYNASLSGVPARGRFSPMLFKGMAFSTGGYSAEYGQALSAVVVLNTEDLAPETQTGISLLSLGGLSLSHQHRAERSSVAVTGDYLNMRPYFGLVPQHLLTAFESGGGSVALRQKTGEMGMLKLYGQFTRQTLGVRLPDAEWPAGRPAGVESGNSYVNTTFRGPLRRGWSVQTGLAATRDQQSQRFTTRDAGTGEEHQQVARELEQSLVGRLVLTNDSASAYWNLKVGVEGLAQRDQQRYQAQRDTLFQFDEGRAAGFAEVNFTLSNKLVGRVGGRGEYSAVLHRWNAAPRVAVAYQLNEKAQLSGAWGYFYETPANDLLLRARAPQALRFERARHLQLTYLRTYQDRTLRVEAYTKAYASLVRYEPGQPSSALTPYDPASYRSAGTGYARGVDVLWRDKKTIKNGDYWISYGLLDTRRQQRQDPVLAVPTFAARHNLSVVGKYWVGKMHTLVGATYTYNSPRAYYNPNDLTGYNAGRLPSFQDLSLNASYVTTLRKNFTIVHVSCTNVLGRQNVFGYRYGPVRDASGQFPGVAVLPSAPRMVFVALLISINKKRPADTTTAPE
ncbi:TonB-dependent receptor [Hymenobacter algoricola]|uniref:TonB-dependent receptor n=1 Tax=Hymenobacter algoricola TaxID=486267 RepID=A0ABP7MHA5_9BACT